MFFIVTDVITCLFLPCYICNPVNFTILFLCRVMTGNVLKNESDEIWNI